MYLSKSSGTGALLPGRGLINPAFVIKIVPATDDLQQKPSTGRDNPDNDYLDNLKVGNQVQAKVSNKTIVGSVERIIKNELGDGVYVIVIDARGKSHKIEGSQIKKVNTALDNSDKDRLVSSPAIFNESKFLSFSQFSPM
jgi:hypothetical protein